MREELDSLLRHRGAAAKRIIKGLDDLLSDARAEGLDHAVAVLEAAKSRLDAAAKQADEELRSRAIGDPSCPAGYR